MNIPINCPICGDPLVNIDEEFIVYKNCRRRPTHIFSCVAYHPERDNAKVARAAFTLSMSPLLSIKFYPEYRTMYVDKSAPTERASLKHSQFLPFYIEPDFSNYKKLVNKLKIYILFS